MESPGVEQPHVVEGTSAGGGGWAAATGNNSRSNSGWFGMDPVSKSVNALTADLLGDGLNADSTSGHAPAESGESQLPPLMGEALPETQGEGTPQEEAHTREHTTVKTGVPVVADAATAGPTTAGDSPEGGGEGEGEGGEGGEKVADDEWGIQVKTKKFGKVQMKRLREKARKQAQKGEKTSPRPPSGATPNSVDNSVVQEPKPVATVPVDTHSYRGGRRSLCGCEGGSGEGDAPVIVEKPDATATTAETAADDFADDDETGW